MHPSLVLELYRHFDENQNASETLMRRRARWLFFFTQEVLLGGEFIAVSRLAKMFPHGLRLVHLYVLRDYYRGAYMADENQYATMSGIRRRVRALKVANTNRAVDEHLRKGVDEGMWTFEKNNNNRSTNRVVPTETFLREDSCAAVIAYVSDFTGREPAERAEKLEFWTDELGFNEEALLNFSGWFPQGQLPDYFQTPPQGQLPDYFQKPQ